MQIQKYEVTSDESGHRPKQIKALNNINSIILRYKQTARLGK